jgi:phosphoenolpyruvate carboxykinase (GTP)
MIERIEGQGAGQEHLFGTSPRYEDLRWDGLAFSREQFASVIGIDRAAWEQEFKLHDALFDQLAYHLPQELADTKTRLESRLEA